ncbi:MAG: FAD-binding domain-containing protein [Myxococcota bacterium]
MQRIESGERRSVVWFKRDLRLRDHPALHAAFARGGRVRFVYFWERSVRGGPDASRLQNVAIAEALVDLERALKARGHSLLIRHAEATEGLAHLHEEWPFDGLFSHEEIGTNLTWKRDRAVARWCIAEGVRWMEYAQTGVFRRLRDRGERMKRWRAFMRGRVLPIPEDAHWRATAADELTSDPLPSVALQNAALLSETLSVGAHSSDAKHAHSAGGIPELNERQRTGEADAKATLRSFLRGRAEGYVAGISKPLEAQRHGSRLSAHLAWGTVSPRVVFAETERAIARSRGQLRRSLEAFRSRLHWRDHFMQRLESETAMEHRPLHRAFEHFAYEGNAHLPAFLEGRTGFPMVDASIRCARETGFLNFRMRALVVSAACHLLRIDWRALRDPLAQLWLDYEPGIHIAQLQMQAGVVGINALRIYSPARQIDVHDPRAAFVRRWVPELRPFSPGAIVAHQRSSRPLGDYPPPRVDAAVAGRRMARDHRRVLRSPEAQATSRAVAKRHGSRMNRQQPSSSRRR